MRTKDLFKLDRSARRINESIEKVFGKKLNLESFDLDQLQDARNKLRTQLSQQRNSSGFNENIENDAYTKAQWMLDAINSEIQHREEFIVDDVDQEVAEDAMKNIADELGQVANDEDFDKLYDLLSNDGPIGKYLHHKIEDIIAETGLHPKDDFEKIEMMLMDIVQQEFGDPSYDKSDTGPLDKHFGGGAKELTKGLNIRGQESTDLKDPNLGEAYINTSKDAINTLGALRKIGKSIERGQSTYDGNLANMYANDVYDVMSWLENNADTSDAKFKQIIAPVIELRKKAKSMERESGSGKDARFGNEIVNTLYPLMQWIEMNVQIKVESIDKDNDMRKLRESEIDQASAIVTANTMVDRLGRWIEELSGMENETLLQLGDSIRDQMGQEQSRQFIEAVAPTLQSALETLKSARESVSGAVRSLATGESPDAMLGAPSDMDDLDMSDPDAMNAGDLDIGPEEPVDDFDAAEPASGGLETAGRAKRESIDFQNRLLKVLAG